MSRQIQFRRGTADEHKNFTGAEGEITVDLTNKTLRVHDGVTAGGTMLAKKSDTSNFLLPPDWGRAVSKEFGITHTASTTGWLFINATQRLDCKFTINGKSFYIIGDTLNNYNKINTLFIPIAENDTYTCENQAGGVSTYTAEILFIPCKSI